MSLGILDSLLVSVSFFSLSIFFVFLVFCFYFLFLFCFKAYGCNTSTPKANRCIYSYRNRNGSKVATADVKQIDSLSWRVRANCGQTKFLLNANHLAAEEKQ